MSFEYFQHKRHPIYRQGKSNVSFHRNLLNTGLLLALVSVLTAGLTPHQVYEKAASAVVFIQVDNAVMGSGFLVSSDGKIVTNLHVIAHTKKATVRLDNGDAYDDVQVLDFDKRKDIAILKIKGADLPFLRLGKSANEDIGSTVYTISNPIGYQNTLSQGLISSIRSRDGFHVLQITAPISHGSSGGPLLNAKGEVIGVTSSVDDKGQNINFAIPVDYARGLLVSPGQVRSLASVYDPTSSETEQNEKQQATLKPLDKGKLFGQAVVQITLTLLTCWFAARILRQLWRKSNKQKSTNTAAILWFNIGLPALFCTMVATALALVELYTITQPH
jgi:S1-C subfamily serine protease